VESERDESPVSDVKRIMIRMFHELKEDIQKQLNECQQNTDKKHKKTHKWLNELREDFNKFQNEIKEIIKKRDIWKKEGRIRYERGV
jgi:site-specific DNA-adenine methylase